MQGVVSICEARVAFCFLGTEALIKGVSLLAVGRCEAAAVLGSWVRCKIWCEKHSGMLLFVKATSGLFSGTKL